MNESRPDVELPSLISKYEPVVLYPLNERYAERDRIREAQWKTRMEKRRYRVHYETNRGYGPRRWTGYYNFYWLARLAAFWYNIPSKADLTHIELETRW